MIEPQNFKRFPEDAVEYLITLAQRPWADTGPLPRGVYNWRGRLPQWEETEDKIRSDPAYAARFLAWISLPEAMTKTIKALNPDGRGNSKAIEAAKAIAQAAAPQVSAQSATMAEIERMLSGTVPDNVVSLKEITG